MAPHPVGHYFGTARFASGSLRDRPPLFHSPATHISSPPTAQVRGPPVGAGQSHAARPLGRGLGDARGGRGHCEMRRGEASGGGSSGPALWKGGGGAGTLSTRRALYFGASLRFRCAWLPATLFRLCGGERRAGTPGHPLHGQTMPGMQGMPQATAGAERRAKPRL